MSQGYLVLQNTYMQNNVHCNLSTVFRAIYDSFEILFLTD